MPEGRRGARVSRRRARATDDLLPRFIELLDKRAPATSLAALELLAYELSRIFDAAAWSISATTEDGTGIQTVRGVESHSTQVGPARRRAGRSRVYPLAEYPTTAARSRTAPLSSSTSTDPGSTRLRSRS